MPMNPGRNGDDPHRHLASPIVTSHDRRAPKLPSCSTRGTADLGPPRVQIDGELRYLVGQDQSLLRRDVPEYGSMPDSA